MAEQVLATGVMIAMLTFRRPVQLARVLPELVKQAGALSPPARIVVVDNDPAGGARPEVLNWAASGVCYVHEPQPGIAAARNRALQEAAGSAALVFIDDDELPGEDWLFHLVDSWREWRCAAVSGPVVPRFESPPTSWIIASGAFARRERVTGSSVHGAATNNLLLDLAAVRRHGLRFDESFGLTGGEDTMFTHHLVALGEQIRWCDEAEVFDPVPTDRSTRAWVLRRTYRAGTSWSRMELVLAGGPSARLWCRSTQLVRAAVKIALGALDLALGIASRSVERQARAACQVVSYAGLASGTFGFSYREYGRSPR